MGLPIWPNYNAAEKAKATTTVKKDPTAAARSSIRRRPSIHRRPVPTATAAQPGARTTEATAVRDETTRRHRSTLQTGAYEQFARQTARSREQRGTTQTETSRRREAQHGTQLPAVPPLRRDTTQYPRSPTHRSDRSHPAEASMIVHSPSSYGNRRSLLPTPPLELSDISQQEVSRLRLPPPPPGWTYTYVSPSDLHQPASPSRSLAGQDRSQSPISVTGDHWEVVRSTVVEDDDFLSGPSDSFASGAAPAASFPASTDITMTGDMTTPPEEQYSYTPEDLECIYPSDFESEPNYREHPAGHDRLRINDVVADESHTTRHEDLDRARHQTYGHATAHELAQVQHGTTSDIRHEPETQQPDRFSNEIRQRSRDAIDSTHYTYHPSAPPPAPRMRHNDPILYQYDPRTGPTGAPPTTTTSSDDRQLRTRLSHLADTRSEMRSSADLLSRVSTELTNDADLEQMRGILERLARRQDIPDEWWMSAGLSREQVREHASGGGVARPGRGVEVEHVERGD